MKCGDSLDLRLLQLEQRHMCVYVCVTRMFSPCYNNSYTIGCGWVDEAILDIILTRHKHCCIMLCKLLHT